MMTISQRMDLKQSQSMAMTPRMQESIKILQLSTFDLRSYVVEQIEENPFLEQGTQAADGSVCSEQAEDRLPEDMLEDGDIELHDTDRSETRLVDKADQSGDQEVWEGQSVTDAVYEPEGHMYEGASRGVSGTYDASASDRHYEMMGQISDKPMSLREFILDQVHMVCDQQDQRFIAYHLTDLLDANGYLTDPVEHIASSLQCDVAQVTLVLEMLKGFEPTGVFAKDLSECLALQLQENDRLDPAMKALVENLDYLAQHNFKALKRTCQVGEDDLHEMIQEIRALNPRPASLFQSELTQLIQPDVFLRRLPDDCYLVELNHDILPKVLVNRKYGAVVEHQLKDKKDVAFLKTQLQTASWLTKALDQRANTILKVATEIVRVQEDFFNKGIRYLKPLVLHDIASAIEMHESTVSRVINGKYLSTGSGLYELKYFFSSFVSGCGKESDVSSTTVKFLIKEITDKEDSRKILSDDAISAILKDRGISIARRTVVKYREAMKIPSSVQRRRDKAL